MDAVAANEAGVAARLPLADELADAAEGLPAIVSDSVPASAPIRVLMLAENFMLAYRAMRAFAAAGTNVSVLGEPASSGLRLSRYCRPFRRSRFAIATPSDDLADEINACIRDWKIDLVVAGDPRATRTLLVLRPALAAAAFPMPSVAAFDLLNNKWRFTQLCGELGICCPPSRLVPDRDALRRGFDAGALPLPCILKPLDLESSRGVMPIRTRGEVGKALAAVDYAPILVQDLIDGEDIGASVYCEEGAVRAFVAHRLKRATYATFAAPEIEATIAAIAAATGATGILNFDMIRAGDGTIYWLECNPRVFYKIFLSSLAGLDFAAFGLPRGAQPLTASLPDGASVRTTKAILADLPLPWRLTRRDWRFVRAAASDPVPFLRELVHLEG